MNSLTSAIVSIIAASDGPGTKNILNTVLSKSRNDDAEVRLGVVHIVHQVWQDLGIQVVTGLSEVILYSSEMLEDADYRVERAVRKMIKTVEHLTGEDLSEQLKK